MSAIWLPMWKCSSYELRLLAAALQLVAPCAPAPATVRPNFEFAPDGLGPAARRRGWRAARARRAAACTPVAIGERQQRSNSEYFSMTGTTFWPSCCADEDQRQHRAVLDAVADEQRLVVDVRQARDQLGLRAALEAHAVRPAGVEHLLDDLVQLVHLDRVDAAIDVAVARLGDRRCERLVEPPHPGAQHVLEADQHGELRRRGGAARRRLRRCRWSCRRSSSSGARPRGPAR